MLPDDVGVGQFGVFRCAQIMVTACRQACHITQSNFSQYLVLGCMGRSGCAENEYSMQDYVIIYDGVVAVWGATWIYPYVCK